ncbi:MAG TPA: hypothetical protein VGL48_08990 [Acidimicrobiales bacterium]|jgi:hypothetical protein
MKLFGRSGSPSSGDAGEVRRVTGTPHPHPELGGAEGTEAQDNGSAPASGRLQRLAQAVDRSRRNRSDRDIRKIMQVLGMLAVGFGFVCIILGWYGASHSPYLYQEIPYLISGGLLGVALVIGGGVLVRCAWSLRQVEEARRNAVAIVRSVDRLEKVLRSLGDGTLTNGTQRDDDLREDASSWQ